jgi:hypothetical protein
MIFLSAIAAFPDCAVRIKAATYAPKLPAAIAIQLGFSMHGARLKAGSTSMMRKITAFVAAAALAAAALAPAAQAQHYGGWGGGWGGYGHRNYYRHYHRYDRGDVAAIGIVGLALGLALGAAVSSDRYSQGGCSYDACGQGYAPPPPPPQYRGYDPGRGGPPPQSYAPPPQGYDGGYRDGSAYEDDYGVAPKAGDPGPQASNCTHAERQWDRYANRYVTVDVPC